MGRFKFARQRTSSTTPDVSRLHSLMQPLNI